VGPGRPGASGLADRVSRIAQRAADRGFFMSGAGRSAVAAPAPQSTAASAGWRVGQNVTHPKFGAGVIVSCEGHGADARVQVRFSGGAQKWLALEYAKLSPA
jgi:DNA helicase-2/ATP-dependent DNA helicase PcrA